MHEEDSSTDGPRLIDVHCHYLPAVDDGARDIQDAIALVRAAREDGTRVAVLTPHVFAGRWDNSLSMLRPRFAAFRKLIASKRIDIRLCLGAEVHLLPESIQLVEAGEAPMLGAWDGMPVMLLELPDGRIPSNALSGVRHLLRLGVLPMIAHPERNKDVMRDVDVIEPFVLEGCLLQLTAASVIGEFGERAARASRELLDRGWATLVASDAHHRVNRPPRLRAAHQWLTEHYGADIASEMTSVAPARIVAGRAVLGLDGEEA